MSSTFLTKKCTPRLAYTPMPVSKLVSVSSRKTSQYLLKSSGWSTSFRGGMLESLQGNISRICLRVKPQKLDDFKLLEVAQNE